MKNTSLSKVNFECVRSIEPNAIPASTYSPTDSPSEGGETSANAPSSSQQPQSLRNSKEAYLEVVRILLVLLENVMNDPYNPKYRSIRIENKTIKEKLLSQTGVAQLLTAIGFKHNATEYTLPESVPLRRLQEYYDVLKKRRDCWLNSAPPTDLGSTNMNGAIKTVSSTRPSNPGPIEAITSSKPYNLRTSFSRVLKYENSFLQSLEVQSDQVMQYNDPQLIAAGRALIPIDELTQNASEKLIAIQEQIAAGEYTDKEPCIRDLIIVELCNWFNTSFFEWVNNMPCRACGSDESKLRRIQMEGDIRVEISFCCGQETKFYRYNDIAELLVSRKGRCGEYANCFTFLCHCLDYDARLVCPRFDHVWTEVYSESQNRWLHVDPSDNVVDSPLMYQHGWKRSIDYVIAYSTQDVQDVTWRYVNNHKKTLQTRRMCSEKDLVDAIITLRNKRQSNLTAERVKELSQRSIVELFELTVERNPTENELKGRSSGSLAWRQSRGESSFNDIFVFIPNEEEIKAKQFNVRYSCSRDLYERYLTVGNGDHNILHTYKTWQSAQFSSMNIFRKVERDWKMVYLARQEGIEYGEIVWKFDFSSANLKIKSYQLKFEKKTFGEGQINVSIISADGNTNIIGSSVFEIKAKLSGGKGDLAWQHAQLFRQSLNDDGCLFDLEIQFV